jgi:hypothetical protein
MRHILGRTNWPRILVPFLLIQQLIVRASRADLAKVFARLFDYFIAMVTNALAV